ncbi:putative exodeoxyribonuclease VII, large subunit [Clostridium sp. MSTE9]|uniref:exodeoxyribonuclease VII large subunit n=1 Tax=Clostridium sp. (strain MSTE9) TaxID=1105031 RepID=UPI00026F38C6|nr:exodeoxyribonuclease VII large subunit [Clostridium sp. MSTE9]EJF39799.1 putative exodeoxyribonuclease VII, large subunit [Clostridium sp. MSTE9]
MNTPVVLTISQLNRYIKSLLDGDQMLSSVFLTGEISNFTNHYKSGHMYFSLKDSQCVVRAVMFAAQARRLRFLPQDGMKVIVRGRVTVYEQSGQYQVYVDDMQPDGLGALNLAYEQLKTRLAAEGLFDASRKKPLPAYPKAVGVVTSPTGAAVQDIKQILGRRFPLAEVILCPVLVQGAGAADQIAAAVERFNRLDCADVLIVGRGGGSMEDLWAFNEEIVARAVANSRIPVISAVGHETDFTICDFAADLRAPTPSAAAELAVPDIRELMAYVSGSMLRMKKSLGIEMHRMQIDRLVDRMSGKMKRDLETGRMCLAERSASLQAFSPLRVLARGYSVALDADGETVRSAAQVRQGDSLNLIVQDGRLACTVNEVREEQIGQEGDTP